MIQCENLCCVHKFPAGRPTNKMMSKRTWSNLSEEKSQVTIIALSHTAIGSQCLGITGHTRIIHTGSGLNHSNRRERHRPLCSLHSMATLSKEVDCDHCSPRRDATHGVAHIREAHLRPSHAENFVPSPSQKTALPTDAICAARQNRMSCFSISFVGWKSSLREYKYIDR